MKQNISPTAVGIIIGLVVVVIVVVGFYTLGGGESQPTVKAREWRPPGAWGGAPGTASAPETAKGP